MSSQGSKEKVSLDMKNGVMYNELSWVKPETGAAKFRFNINVQDEVFFVLAEDAEGMTMDLEVSHVDVETNLASYNYDAGVTIVMAETISTMTIEEVRDYVVQEIERLAEEFAG